MKVAAPGIYDLTMDEYHSDCCDGPSVSASRLHTLIAQCPAIFWETSPLNPQRVEEKKTKALDVGRAAHALVLGEPEFAKHFYVCPHDSLSANPGRAWNDTWKIEVAAGRERRTLIRKADFDDISDMARAQRRSPQVSRAFEKGKPEQSFITKDAETGIFLKVRPDWTPQPIRHGFLVDYKTSKSIMPRKLASDAFSYGYHMQAAMQFDVVAAVTGEKPVGIAHVCQEKSAPYLAELKMFTPEQLEFGRREYRRALQLFAQCWEAHLAGKPERMAWPGYTVDPQYYETPRWIAAAMESKDEYDRYAAAHGDGTTGAYTAADYVAAG